MEQVIDVGACHGDFAQAATVMFPYAHVLLVEPSVGLQTELRRRCAEHGGRWDLAPYALGVRSGPASLYLDPHQPEISSLSAFTEKYRRMNPTARMSGEQQCHVQTLDELCHQHRITSVDLLKVDVEGSEFDVLEGARSMLAKTRAVIIELSLIRSDEAADALERLLRCLRLATFEIVDIEPSFYDPANPWRPVEFNVLARRDH